MKKTLFIIVILISALSCQKGDEPLMMISGYVSAEKGSLYRDDGKIYVPSSNPGIDLNSGRYFIKGYATENYGNEKYKVTLTGAENCRIGSPLISSEIADPKQVGDDAVSPFEIFAAGKYLNLAAKYCYFDDKDHHDINLVFYDAKSNKDTLYFELCHQANKDTLSQGKSLKGLYFYISYDISKLAPKDRNTVVINLKNKWYKSSGTSWLPEREELTTFVSYEIYFNCLSAN